MGKVEVSALIKAIQESVSLLVSDGLAARPKITDPVVDATYVEGLESGYSDEIDEIVDNIPDVPPTPPEPTPTVYTGYFNAGNGNAQKSAEVSWGSTGDQYEGVYPLNSDTAYQFDASATYTILSVFYTDGETVTNETLAPYSISGSVKMINNPWASGELMLKTKVNNRITGRPCGCTFTVE